MFKQLLMSGLAVGALALNAPAAQADAPTFDCSYRSVQLGAVSQTYEGTAEGFVVHAGDPEATIRCYVTVDGTEVSTTMTGTGVTAGPVSFSAPEGARIELCAEAGFQHQGTWAYATTCGESTTTPIPPDEFWDLIDGLFINYIDPVVCVGLAMVPGTYGDVTIHPGGDVDVAGEPFYTCAPY